MKHLVIIGAGGFAREVYDCAQNAVGYQTEFDIKGFIEGDIPIAQEEYKKLPMKLLGDIKTYAIDDEDVFICGIGSPVAREKICSYMEGKGAQFINIIHKTAFVSESADLGIGIVACRLAGIGCNTSIGNHVVINSISGLGHDASVGSYSVISAMCDLTGYVQCGYGTFWGSGARALPHAHIGNKAIIGAGSVVLKKVKAGATVFGNPALEIGAK